MPLQQPIPFSTMNIPDLVAVHNQLAQPRGFAPLRAWGDSRCKLVERVAILRTYKPIPPEPKKGKAKRLRRLQPIRDAILEALAFISHYEDAKTGEVVSKRAAKKRDPKTLLSIGLAYPEIIKRVRHRLRKPKWTCEGITLRWTAAKVRNGAPGFEHGTLPQKRPHSAKGKTR